MPIQETTVKRFIGTSTDAKPALGLQGDGSTIAATDLPAGSSFLESDTGRIYRWNGADAWTLPELEEDPQLGVLRALQLEMTQLREMTEMTIDGGAKVVTPDRDRLWVSPWVLVPFGATSGALEANDALGDMFTFALGERRDTLPARGRILSIAMVDQDDDTLAATIHIFDHPFTAAASDAAFTISVADSPNWVASELFPSPTDIGGAKVVTAKDVNVDYYAPSGKLYAQLSSTGTPNIASAAVMPLVRLFILSLE